MSKESITKRIILSDIKQFIQLVTPTKQQAKKVVGLDLSPMRIGVAISDIKREFALPLGTLHNERTNREQEQGSIRKRNFIIKPNGIKLINKLKMEEPNIGGWVIGLPLSLDGDPSGGPQAQKILQMIDMLPRVFGMNVSPILLHDERFSTVMARAVSSERPDLEVLGLDAFAAAHILQEILDYAARFEVTGDGGRA